MTKQDFRSVFEKPHKIKLHGLVALYKPAFLPHARLGIVIGKHIVKQAVMRSRLRRIVRESFRLHKEQLKGLDIIVLLRSEWNSFAKRAWRAEVDQLWKTLANLSKTY